MPHRQPLVVGLPVITLLSIAMISTTVLAQDPDPIDLVGTWINVEGEYAYWDGRTTNVHHDYEEVSIVVNSQDGATLFADQVVEARSSDHPGRHGSEPIGGSKTPMLGAISFDNTRVVFADIGDTTTLQCTLVGEDTLDCLVWEAGDHALAGRKRLKRQQP